jgi:hypothetical protein
LKKKIKYNKTKIKRAIKSNPHSNETYYLRLKEVNGEMEKFEIIEESNYWIIKPKDEIQSG